MKSAQVPREDNYLFFAYLFIFSRTKSLDEKHIFSDQPPPFSRTSDTGMVGLTEEGAEGDECRPRPAAADERRLLLLFARGMSNFSVVALSGAATSRAEA
jgi:hypothetical protein